MFGTLKRYLRYTSWPIVAATLALIVFGISAIRVSEMVDESLAGQSTRQMIYVCVGLAAFLIAMIVPYPRVGRAAYALFALTLLLLVAVLFTRPIKGATRWFDLGITRIQPSEIAKLTYILMLAWYLRFGDHYRRLRGLLIPFVLAFVPMGLILWEPDLGTALLFLPTLYFMLLAAGAKLRHLLLIMALGLAVVFFPVPRSLDSQRFAAEQAGLRSRTLGPLSFYSVDETLPWRDRPRMPLAYCRVGIGAGSPYDIQPLCLRVINPRQSQRVEGWLRQNDPRVALKEGFQLRWSIITLATGRWAGQAAAGDGRDNLLPLALGKLPEEHTDFIFSVIGGRWGFLGCLAVLGLYAVIFVFGVEIATITNDPFGRLLAVGALALLLTQVFINIAMTMGLMPITGMTLPFISYGGSSLVINCVAIGLLINVGQRRPILLSPRPFEHDKGKGRNANVASRRESR